MTESEGANVLDWWQVITLAVVQGIAEFLPISSSGHIVIVAALFSPTGDSRGLDVTELNIMLHGGTLLSILVFYRRQILRLLLEDRRVLPRLIVGTLPAVAVGLPLKLFAEPLLEHPLLAGCLLPLTGLVLLSAARRPPGEGDYRTATYLDALWIGTAQALAILPGLSRSGLTISAALWRGQSRDSAAAFSFLLAIPAIAGATALEIADLAVTGEAQTPLPLLLAGVAVSFVVGLAALWWLLDWLRRGRLHYFAAWCIAVGGGVILWQLLK